MRYLLGSAQHKGDRDDQQDVVATPSFSAGFAKHGGALVILADGMGGLENGALASKTAVETFKTAYSEKTESESVQTALQRSLSAANDAVFAINKHNNFKPEIGTTFVAAVVCDELLDWVSVGDSRLYVLRDKAMHQLSRDHTYSQVLEQNQNRGLLSEEDALTHPDREALTSFLGLPALVDVNSSDKSILLKGGDHVIVCSDGLYRGLTVEDVNSNATQNPKLMAQRLVDCVLSKHLAAQDNASVGILYLQKTWAEILEPLSDQLAQFFQLRPKPAPSR